jgi:hypothetical protein
MTLTNVARVNGGGFFEIDPTTAETGIQAAIDSLGSTGGIIDLYPGTATYQINATPILSDTNGVHIRGHGAVIGFNGSTSLYGMRIRGSGWTLEGIKFTDTPASGLVNNTRHIISVEDNSVEYGSNNFKLLNCKFEVTLGSQSVRDYRCLTVTGNGDTNSGVRRGLEVRGCRFTAGVNSIPDTKFVTASSTPYGIHFIKTDNSGSQTIVDNVFGGTIAASTLADSTGPLDTVRSLGAHSAGAFTMAWDTSDGTLTGILQPGSTFTVATDSTNTVYKITKQATAGSNQLTVFFYPALAESVADNDGVTVTAISAYGHVASAIHLTDHLQTEVKGNKFTFLSTQAAASGEGGNLIHLAVGGGESGHSTVHHNLFEDVDAWHVIRAENIVSGYIPWVFIDFNKFGRMIPKCEAMISLYKANDFTAIGNGFHNIGGGPHGTVDTNGYPIYYEGCRHGLIAMCTGAIMDLEEDFAHDGGDNENVHVLTDSVPGFDYP